jgi:amino acid permease
LGGAFNTLPIIFSKIKPTKYNYQIFRFAALFAIFVSFIINLLWCYFIIRSVPQRATSAGSPSLLKSERNGDISTIPLIEVIKTKYPEFQWISILTDIFITISITVSFITVGSGFKQQRKLFFLKKVDGYVKSFQIAKETRGTFVRR